MKAKFCVLSTVAIDGYERPTSRFYRLNHRAGSTIACAPVLVCSDEKTQNSPPPEIEFHLCK
jgi:hypothetical protein